MKRLLVGVNVPDDIDTEQLAGQLEGTLGQDVAVWPWRSFFADVAVGLVGPDGDDTTDVHEPAEKQVAA